MEWPFDFLATSEKNLKLLQRINQILLTLEKRFEINNLTIVFLFVLISETSWSEVFLIRVMSSFETWVTQVFTHRQSNETGH